MATQPYRNQPTSLQDLLNHASAQPDAPVDTPTAPQPSSVGIDGVMTPQERERVLNLLLQPESPGPAPEVDKPNALAMIFSGLGDAVNAFNAGRNGQPGLGSNTFDQYLRRLDQQKADRRQWEADNASAQNRARMRGANYLLSRDGQARGLAATATDKAEQRAYDAAKQKERLAQDEAQFQQQKTWEAQKAREQHDFELTMQKASQAHAEKLAGISRRIADGDKSAQREQEALGSAMAYVGGTADGVMKMLEGDPANNIPPMSIEEVQTKYRRAFDAMTKIGLVGDARKAADAYLAQEVGPVIRQYGIAQQNAALGAGSPQQETWRDRLAAPPATQSGLLGSP